MVKRHTTLNIEDDLLIKAKDKGINVSEELEKSLKQRLNIEDVQINNSVENCEFCGREGTRETADDVERTTNTKNEVEHPDLLTWLWPDEKWICNNCLRKKARKCI